MQIRREIGNRVIEPVPPKPVLRGPEYLVAHGCLDCRTSFERPTSGGQLVCPACGQRAYQMGRYFKAPRKADVKQWRKVLLLYASGFRFWSSARGDAPALPHSLREAERFVEDNPEHPYRVTDPDEALLVRYRSARA
jgi:DNA-directed RNA polymerase subunit RPC12/RpoP